VSKHKNQEISQLHLIRGKHTFADVGVIGVLYAELWNFDSDGLVNRAINGILEEEGLCSRFVTV
jgi:hypothetical protein